MIKSIAVFGATGHIGLPVTNALIEAGYKVSVLVRDADIAKNLFPKEVEIVKGNIKYHHDLKKFLTNKDAVYCNLNVSPSENRNSYHIETDGLRDIINASLECGIKRIMYLSSLVQNYQGENGFNWWAFDVKKEAINYVRDSGIPYTIFYPSNFMENFTNGYKHGRTLRLIGESRFPMFYISVKDYSRMVVNSLKRTGNEEREYNIQGLNCYTIQEAAELFAIHYTKEKIKVKTMPIGLAKFLSLFNSQLRYDTNMSEALNNYEELFVGELAWEELGKPQITFEEFAKNAE